MILPQTILYNQDPRQILTGATVRGTPGWGYCSRPPLRAPTLAPEDTQAVRQPPSPLQQQMGGTYLSGGCGGGELRGGLQ